MDQLFMNLVGKLSLNPPKIISIVLDNFSYIEDQARFLKASLAIPQVKQLPITKKNRILLQIGTVHDEINKQLSKENWTIKQYQDLEEPQSICDKIAQDLSSFNNRSLIFINDISRLELTSTNGYEEAKKFIDLAHQWKVKRGHFTVILYQNSHMTPNSKLMRDLQTLSDAMVRVKTCKVGYFKEIWWETVPSMNKTMIPPRIETSYLTCKIGKFYWSYDLLCFYDKKTVPKNYNLDEDTCLRTMGDSDSSSNVSDNDLSKNEPQEWMSGENFPLFDSDEERDEVVRPYTSAQNPQKSQIFYYPDKDDDFDEDDPDNDLNI